MADVMLCGVCTGERHVAAHVFKVGPGSQG